MLNQIDTTTRDNRRFRLQALAGGGRSERPVRHNPWMAWRPESPAMPPVLSIADFAECQCPDLCDRDHDND